MNGNRGKIYFSLFFGLSAPVLAKNNSGKRFLKFLIFFLFFSKFSCPGRVWTEFRTKFFFLFFGLSHPVLAKTNAEKRFFNFLIFFSIFFGIFLPGSSINGIRDKIFFLSFSVYLILFWLKIMLERGFSIFSNFLLFFLEFSSLGWVWTEFETKIFFSLSWPLSTLIG